MEDQSTESHHAICLPNIPNRKQRHHLSSSATLLTRRPRQKTYFSERFSIHVCSYSETLLKLDSMIILVSISQFEGHCTLYSECLFSDIFYRVVLFCSSYRLTQVCKKYKNTNLQDLTASVKLQSNDFNSLSDQSCTFFREEDANDTEAYSHTCHFNLAGKCYEPTVHDLSHCPPTPTFLRIKTAAPRNSGSGTSCSRSEVYRSVVSPAGCLTNQDAKNRKVFQLK